MHSKYFFVTLFTIISATFFCFTLLMTSFESTAQAAAFSEMPSNLSEN